MNRIIKKKIDYYFLCIIYNSSVTYTFSVYRHRERRKYLRTALKELALILTDQPGLIGPKVLLVFIGLSLARDEVCWLLRHGASNSGGGDSQKGTGKSSSSGKSSAIEDLLVDRQLPELLFHMEELRSKCIYYISIVSALEKILLFFCHCHLNMHCFCFSVIT